ncbi:uncharacterized protein LOC130670267 [Microplitis mediator]|uniref:uncharacterized protein LOC130670267 n=1 Tax=Microplitis mediator TaxID=375433 RepID=UPI002555A426|nr:uncharacterized protein LOC130670267 [Microplitis mediator]
MVVKIIKVPVEQKNIYQAAKEMETDPEPEPEMEPEYIDEESLEYERCEESMMPETVKKVEKIQKVEKKKKKKVEIVWVNKKKNNRQIMYKQCEWCKKSCISLINHYRECEKKKEAERQMDEDSEDENLKWIEQKSAQSQSDSNDEEGVGRSKKKFVCNICCYNSENKNNFWRHLQSPRHRRNCQHKKRQAQGVRQKKSGQDVEDVEKNVQVVNTADQKVVPTVKINDKVYLILKKKET